MRWYLRDDVDRARMQPLLLRLLSELRSGRLTDLKQHGRRKAFFELALHPEASHLLKVNTYAGVRALRRHLLGSKARRELVRAERCAARGVATPVPLAAGEELDGVQLRRCLLLVERIPGAEDLGSLWHGRGAGRCGLGAAEQRRVARAFGAFARHSHEAGIFQDDFALNNFLLRRGAAPELWMIDFERARLLPRVGRRRRCRMLAKLHRELLDAPASLRLHFLQAYAGSPEASRWWWRAVEQEVALLAQHDLRRMGRHGLREGRLYRTVRDGTWRGVLRRDVPAEVLQGLREARAERLPEKGVAALPGFWKLYASPGSSLRRVWIELNFLHVRRRLAPTPLGYWWSSGASCILVVREPGDALRSAPRAEAEARALAALRDRTRALGFRCTAKDSLAVLRPRPDGRLDALWLRPSGLLARSPARSRGEAGQSASQPSS